MTTTTTAYAYESCVFCGNEHHDIDVDGHCIRCAGFLIEVAGTKENKGTINKRCADGCEEADDTGKCSLCGYWRDVVCGECWEEKNATSCIMLYDILGASRSSWQCIECWVEPGTDEEEEADEAVVFTCCRCNVDVIRNSEQHDNCHTRDGDEWWCSDCHADDDDDEEADE